MVDRVLPKTRTVVVDSAANGGGVVPLLPLGDFFPERKPQITNNRPAAPAPAATTTGGR
jgi:hypothetical protein